MSDDTPRDAIDAIDATDAIDAVDEQARRTARTIARRILTVLRGQEPPAFEAEEDPHSAGAPLPSRPQASVDELLAEAAAGSARAAQALRTRALLAALPERLGRALAFERCQVALADGSALPLDDAERLLAQKELGAPHLALRGLLDDACAHFQQFHFYRSVGAFGAFGVGAGADRALPRRQTLVLEEVLAGTAGLRDAALEALGSLAGAPLGGRAGAALARGLDLPDDTGGFGAVLTLALLRAAREAAQPTGVVARFAAPRQLAGVVLDDGDAVRFAHPPVLERWRRHQLTVQAGAEALVRACLGGTRADRASAATALGRAFSLGLLGTSTRRRLGASRSDAERAARVAACTLVLELRARAALALAADLDDAPSDRDRLGVAREVLTKAWGTEPASSTAAELLTPSWTRAEPIRATVAAEALCGLDAVQAALTLRDRFDEGYALRAESWSPDVRAELLGALEGTHQEADDDARIKARAGTRVRALSDWAGAWL